MASFLSKIGKIGSDPTMIGLKEQVIIIEDNSFPKNAPSLKNGEFGIVKSHNLSLVG